MATVVAEPAAVTPRTRVPLPPALRRRRLVPGRPI